MTTTAARHDETTGARSKLDRPRATADPDLRRGVVLIVGAVVMALLIQPIGPLSYPWNPLLVGLVFLAAAAVVGARSPLWGAGLVVGFWGLAKVISGAVAFSWSGPFSTAMIGLGGLLAAYLASRGFAITVASVAFPVVFIGIGQWVHSTYSGAPITIYTAGLAAAYGVVDVALSLRARRTAAAV